MSDRKHLPGKFVWFELVSRDAKQAQAFYGELLGWTVRPYPMGDFSYDMIYAGDTMIGGYAAPEHRAHWDSPAQGARPTSRWLSYISVEDVDATARAAATQGGKVVEVPFDAPGIGRMARIADPQGAHLYLFNSASGDPADVPVTPHGGWLWNELHTSDSTKALSFYEKVVGFSHRGLDMGPAGTYYIVSKGGVDRGGVTNHLPSGMSAHWLPYVSVDDVDVAFTRAQKLGAEIPMPPKDIPGIGRSGVLQDPTGALLALMKPATM